MKKDHNIQDELKELSPLLTKLRQEEEGYKVPHLYFESLQNKVLGQVNETPQKAGFLARLGWGRTVTMIASVVLLLVVGVFLLPNFNNTQVADLESISAEALAMYLDENVEELELDLFLEDDFQLDFTDGLNLDSDEWGDYIEEELLDSDTDELFF